MRLSEKERNIIACTELNAEMSARKIGKTCGYKDHTVRYSINNLINRKIIRAIPFINIYPLGYSYYNVFFSISVKSTKAKNDFLNHLINSPRVTFLAELGGDFQYELSICAKNPQTVLSFLKELSLKHGNIFFEKSISFRVSANRFNRSFLADKKIPISSISFGNQTNPTNIDELDHKILIALSTDNFTSRRSLAKTMKLPFGTLENRFKKLQEKDVLPKMIYSVNPELCNIQSFKLLIYTKGISDKLSNKINLFAKKHPNIFYIIESLGAWEYEFGVDVENRSDILNISQELYEELGSDINNIKVLSIFRRLKFSLYPFSSDIES